MVVEKTDYLTGRNVRYLRVDTPDLPSSQLGGAGGRAETPPPRESPDEHVGDDGSGEKGEPGPSKLNGWAPPQKSPDQLFGDASATVPSNAGGVGNGH